MKTTAPETGRRAGLTLFELLLTMTLLVAVLGVPAMLLRSGSSAYATETASTETFELARTGVDRIVTRLETAMGGSVGPVAFPVSPSSSLVYNRCLGYQLGPNPAIPGPNEQVEFEYTLADPNDGIDNDGDGLIDEGRVVWTENPGPNQRRVTLLEDVAETALGEVPGNGADDNGNGLTDENGLAFRYALPDPTRVTIFLTVARPGPGGTVITRSLERTVSFRN